MKLSTRIAYNTIIQIASKVISTALGLFTIAVITRHLGALGFGQYTTALTFLSFFAIIADLGLTLVTVQMISREGADEEIVLGNLLALRLVSALFFLGLAPLAVLFFPYEPVVKISVLVASFSFLFVALNQILVGLFQKHLRMDKASIAEIISRIVLLVGVIAVIRMGYSLVSILIITVVSSLVSFLMHYFFSRSFVRIKFRFDILYWRQIIKMSWPLAITIALNLLYLKTDTLLLSIIKRPTEVGIMTEVGLYGAAYKVIDVLITLPFMFAGIILPILTKAWTNGNKEGFKNVLQRSFDVMVMLAVPMLIGTQFLAKDIMVLVAGEEFALSGPILRILILAAVMIFLGNMFAHAVIAIDKQKSIIKAYAFTAVTAVSGYFIFIPFFSYYGAAWVTIYSETAIALASALLVWKFTKFIPNFNVFFKSLMASTVMGLLIYSLDFFHIYNFWAALCLSPIVYFAFLYLFKGIKRQDIEILLNR